MNVIIVSHGPSLIKEPQGDYIDSFEFVVRQKVIAEELLKRPEYFGSKTDAIVGSWNQAPWMSNEFERWVFIDSRFDHLEDDAIFEMCETYGVKIDKAVCDKWNARFRKQRTAPFRTLPDGMTTTTASDEYGHRHMSSGLHALLYTCHFLRPKAVTLIGYDNVQSGNFTWSLARGPDWKQYPDHLWWLEHKMVPQIAREYRVQINYGEGQCAA